MPSAPAGSPGPSGGPTRAGWQTPPAAARSFSASRSRRRTRPRTPWAARSPAAPSRAAPEMMPREAGSSMNLSASGQSRCHSQVGRSGAGCNGCIGNDGPHSGRGRRRNLTLWKSLSPHLQLRALPGGDAAWGNVLQTEKYRPAKPGAANDRPSLCGKSPSTTSSSTNSFAPSASGSRSFAGPKKPRGGWSTGTRTPRIRRVSHPSHADQRGRRGGRLPRDERGRRTGVRQLILLRRAVRVGAAERLSTSAIRGLRSARKRASKRWDSSRCMEPTRTAKAAIALTPSERPTAAPTPRR